MEKVKTLDDYQELAATTRMKSCNNFTYLAFGLVAEVGEVCDKIAKWRRKGKAFMQNDQITFNTSYEKDAEEYVMELAKELGDVMWFVAMLSRGFGLDLSDVATLNIAKLAERRQKNTIVDHADH